VIILWKGVFNSKFNGIFVSRFTTICFLLPKLASIYLKSLYWFPFRTSTSSVRTLLYKKLFSISPPWLPLFLIGIGYSIWVINTNLVECTVVTKTPCTPLVIIVGKCDIGWRTPNLLYRLKCESKVKTTKERGVGARSLVLNTLGVEGRAGAPRWGLGRETNINYSHGPAQPKQHVGYCIVWALLGARTSHGQTRTHKTHHGPNLGEATTFPLIVYYVPLPQGPHPNGILSRDSQMRVPKFPKLGLSQLWGPITWCEDLWLRWGLNQSCSPRQELSNDMLHATCTQEIWVNPRILVVRSQIGNLTPGFSFGHNLCFRCPSESCKPILDIYISIDFQWYNKIFNSLGFDPCNHPLKIQESTETPNSQNGSSLGSVRVHSLTFSFTLELPLGPQPCKPLPWSWAKG
jgi:hypothetical protein